MFSIAREVLGWIAVGCDVFRNKVNDAMLEEKWNLTLPHIEETVPHDTDLLYLGGMSGGALRAYEYSEATARPWKGIPAFGGLLGRRETLHCAPDMVVAIVNGDNGAGANSELKRDLHILNKEDCIVKQFTFAGGHVIAPAPVVLEAMQWMHSATVPGSRLSKGKRSPSPLDDKY